MKIMNNPFASSARNGKIARLPHNLRDQINRRLRDNEPGKMILSWLNSMPEVKTILTVQFDSRPINKQNLSEWRLGGFLDWLTRQEAFESLQREIRGGILAGFPDTPASFVSANPTSVKP